MHTMEALDPDDFGFRVDGAPARRTDAMPALELSDRVGVAMASGTSGLGAGTFLLASVLAFYDRIDGADDTVTYPDYYTIQATAEPADYRMLDVFPAHKNVAMEPDADRLLEAIVDRAIDVLLVPDLPSTNPSVNEITRRSADRTIDVCYVYAPDGNPEEADIEIRVPRDPVMDWFETTVRSVDDGGSTAVPPVGADDGAIRQGFRRIDLDGAISRLGGIARS